MRRFLLILLSVILPFQLAWAGAAAYCQHEAPASVSRHFGHHEHQHKADANAEHDKKVLADSDCGICHMASIPFACPDHPATETLHRVERSTNPTEQGFASLCARAPDRPQWSRLA